jgi:hypothetical protein
MIASPTFQNRVQQHPTCERHVQKRRFDSVSGRVACLEIARRKRLQEPRILCITGGLHSLALDTVHHC